MGECLFVVNGELWSLYDDEHEQGHDNGLVTPGGVEVAAAFEVVLVKVTGLGLLLRCELLACAHAPYMLGDLPFSIARRR